MKRDNDPREEGHTREWADRARVELDPKQDVRHMSSPKQSPDSDSDADDQHTGLKSERDDESVY